MSSFRLVCEELSRLQVKMIRREGNPKNLVAEATMAIRNNRDVLELRRQNLPDIPIFLRSCATLFARANTNGVHEALVCAGKIAEAYVEGNHGDINESAIVLQSLVSLSKTPASELSVTDGDSLSAWSSLSLIKPLVAPSLHNTLEKWKRQQIRPHTSSLLALLQATDFVYGENFSFPPVSADMIGLLPIKGKVQMEAKMQKCVYARPILKQLGEMQFSRFDAAICLNHLAESGFYDAELCNACCEVLFSTHLLVTSQQIARVLYSLGVLQHRHVHQKFFSSIVNFKKCTADALRLYLMGLAMLRQPPVNERALMDGVFLHALRPTGSLGLSSVPGEALSPDWFVTVGHALTCVGVVHHKYRLMLARTVRRSIVHLTTQQRCKMLYALGGLLEESIPEELIKSWKGKVLRTIEVLTEKLRYDVEPSNGPFVMNALLFAGVKNHPMIPAQPDLNSGENPVEVLLSTWASCPKERVLHLTEQIRPCHLGSEPTATLSHVFKVIAGNCSNSSLDSYRFVPLCDAVRSYGSDMSVEEALGIIGAIQRIGIGGHFKDILLMLLKNLWCQRESMTPEQRSFCCSVIKNIKHLDTAVELLNYMSSM